MGRGSHNMDGQMGIGATYDPRVEGWMLDVRERDRAGGVLRRDMGKAEGGFEALADVVDVLRRVGCAMERGEPMEVARRLDESIPAGTRALRGVGDGGQRRCGGRVIGGGTGGGGGMGGRPSSSRE